MKIKLSDSLSLSRIVHGFWRLNNWNLTDSELLNLIEKDIDLGVTTVDHADIYGDYTCEKKFGDALALNPSIRNKLQIVTKCGIKLPSKNNDYKYHIYDTSSKHIISSVENSLNNLHTDHIDLLLIHRPDPLMDPTDVAEAFTKLKKQGKVLNFGVSNFLPSQYNLLNSYLDTPLVTNQIELSVLNLENLHNGTIDLAQEKAIHPMIWSPLAGGNLFTDNSDKGSNVRNALEKVRYETNANSIDEIAYAWLLHHPSKMIPIVGSQKIDRLKAAVNATKIELTKDQWFQIYTASLGHDIP